MRNLAAVLLTAMAACAPTWQGAATATEIGAVGALACDGGTTEQFLADQSAWTESNPVLGEHPSHVRLWGYLGGLAAAVVVANRKLPAKWAALVGGVVLATEAYSVGWNMHVGSSMCGLGHGGPWLGEDPNASAAHTASP